MEAGFIHFDPASEFEVIENIEFEEEISRPESLRFYTLDEQLLDYFDKVLPKKGKVTKFEYTKISGEVDRLRDIYENVITVTDSDYKVDFSRKSINVDWVKPIYTKIELSPYSYETNWNPLFSKETRATPNYYPRLLTALPKPFKTVGTNGVSHIKGGILVDEDGQNAIHTLPVYERTKGVVHEDGSFSVVKIPMTNTADDVKTKGFFIQERSFEIPNPLADHPFLASNQPSKFLTEEPLERVFPTIEAIMTHAIPKTTDPYKEGKKILKAYDLKLSQIHWNLWKDTFAPVDTISATPSALSVLFPSLSEETAPSKKLQDIYIKKWYPGIEPRFWLATQEDNGNLVSKMLLSNAGKAGLVPPAILSEKPVSSLVPSTPEECFLIENFDGFLSSGVYRSPPWSQINTAVDKHKPLPVGTCIPVAQIVQEKTDFLVGDKIAWKETTDEDILKEHQHLLKFFQFVDQKEPAKKYEKYAGKDQSDLRRQIVAVLKDENRLPVDKADAIGKLLRGSSVKNSVYFDNEDLFLVCEHTLSILKGDLENDNEAFYVKWTTVDEGFRACKFCGEQLSADIYAAQDDFDEDGNAIKSHDVLGGISSEEPHMAAFANSIQKLKPAFLLDNPGEAIFYLLISLLQVLPLESQLLPILQNVRELSTVLKANKKIEKTLKERTEGILGIAAMVVLLQTHNPFLIPRRSFGSKILKLSGFPRDTDDFANSPVLDIIISVLKTTFESSPNTFKGPTTTLLRLVISKPKDVRKESIVFLKQAAQKFKTQLLAAKERYEVPSNTVATTQLSLPILPVMNTTYNFSETFLKEEQSSACNIFLPRSYLTGKLPPNVSQEKIILTSAKPSENALYVQKSNPKIHSLSFSDPEIRRRASLKFPKATKLDKLEAFLNSDTDGIAFLSLLNRILDILSKESFSVEKLTEYRRISVFLETTINKSLLRDAARGVLYELFHDITKDINKSGLLSALQTAVQRDLVLSMILLTKEQATSQDSDLRTRERELFKTRMRNMNDTEREATKMLLDIGIAPYIITNEDREIFAKEYRLPDPEQEYAREEQDADIDRPEEGYNAARDIEDDQAAIVNGVEQQVDYGDYGDRREERFGRDYDTNQAFDDDEGYGV
jgi:hypothetical protein